MLIAIPPHHPRVHPEAFVAPSADLVGRVIVEVRASVWFHAVLRAESELITIGPEANVQDGSCAHSEPGFPVVIGRGVTVGHGVILHGCTVEDGALVGMGAIVLDGARIGAEALVGAGTLVLGGQTVPPRTLFAGVPGKVVRDLGDDDLASLRQAAENYVERTRRYRALLAQAE
ncbi:MAG TPA: gamma carbonic anhydrase family protein [bacterium]|nr:gamma carbonic anhydrase family protein [bacterium]